MTIENVIFQFEKYLSENGITEEKAIVEAAYRVLHDKPAKAGGVEWWVSEFKDTKTFVEQFVKTADSLSVADKWATDYENGVAPKTVEEISALFAEYVSDITDQAEIVKAAYVVLGDNRTPIAGGVDWWVGQNLTPEALAAEFIQVAGTFEQASKWADEFESGEGEPGEPSSLTEALEALQAQQKALAEKVEEIAIVDATDVTEADGVAAIDPENKTALDAFVSTYSPTEVKAEATAAAQAVEVKQAAIDLANAALLSARAGNFTSSTEITGKLEGFTAATVLSDANIAKAVTDAKALVAGDKVQYLNDSTATVVADKDGAAQTGYAALYTDGTTISTTKAGNTFVGYGEVLPTSLSATVAGSGGVVTITGTITGFTGAITLTETGSPDIVKVVNFKNGEVVAGQAGVTGTIAGNNLVVSGFSDSASLAAAASYTTDSILEVYTAAQLQTLAQADEANLAADIASKGDNLAIIESLKDAVAAFVAAGGASVTAVNGAATAAATIDAINTILNMPTSNATEVTAKEAAAETYVKTTFAGGFTAPTDGTATAAQKALEAASKVITDRAELEGNVTTSKTTLDATVSGTVLAQAEGLQTTRDGQIKVVTDAEADKVASEEYKALLDALVAEHDAIAKNIEALNKQLEELGVENLVDLSDVAVSTNGTLFGADLFLFTEKTGNVTIGRFEADDMLYLGNGFTRENLKVSDDIFNESHGDASVPEVFFQQDGNNVNLYIESESFDGSVDANVFQGDIITITGVTVDQLSFENGFVTIA